MGNLKIKYKLMTFFVLLIISVIACNNNFEDQLRKAEKGNMKSQ